MSIIYQCDGCAIAVAEPKIIGHVTRRHYCPECVLKADAFLEAEEELRKQFYEQFTIGRNQLIATMSENNFRLPDIA